MSAVYDHAATFYDALAAKSNKEPSPEGGNSLVFRGSVTQVYRDTGISQSYYSKILRLLTEAGCIHYVSRGSRGNESIVALLGPPDAQRLQKIGAPRLTKRADAAKLSLRVEALERAIGGLNIVDALIEMDNRVKALEKESASA